MLKTETSVQTGVWYHIAVVKNGPTYSIYVNGVCEKTGGLSDIDLTNFKIGARPDQFAYFKGTIDDVGVWNHAAALGDIEDPESGTINYARINGVSGPGYGVAWNPRPANEQIGAPNNVTLMWRPGECATEVDEHQVYFGTNFNGVNQGTVSCVHLTEPNYSPGILDSNTTYYWRVDEVIDSNIYRGPVWRFTVRPNPASEPYPLNNAQQVSESVKLSWIPGYYVADTNGHDVYFGTDFYSVKAEYSALVSNMSGDEQVNFTDLWVLCEQWLGYVEGEPQADLNGDKIVNLIDFAIMADEWKGSIVYKGRQTANRYDPCNLEFGTTYFWRVDEFNEPNMWPGEVWSFTVGIDEPNITGTVKPDILGSGVIGGTYNDKPYYTFNVLGWQIINAASYSLPANANYSVENIEYDSVSGKYWWAIKNIYNGGVYLASASSLDGEWIVGSVIASGDAPCLKKFGNKWYLYYDSGYEIYYRDADNVDGPYSARQGPLITKGTYPAWDSGRCSESYVFEHDGTYYLFYMGGNDPNMGAGWLEQVGYATASSPTGPFTKQSGTGASPSPGLSGGDGWNNGDVKAADPYVFQLDPNTNVWYVGITGCVSGKTSYRVGYYQTTDFTTFTEVSTLNPLLTVGTTGAWDSWHVYRGGPPIEVGGQLYIPYQGYKIGAIFSGGLATLNVNPTWYNWYDGAGTWNISTELGVQGSAYWTLTSNIHTGAYTAAGMASGTATVADYSTGY